jgi:hypothetical protein
MQLSTWMVAFTAVFSCSRRCIIFHSTFMRPLFSATFHWELMDSRGSLEPENCLIVGATLVSLWCSQHGMVFSGIDVAVISWLSFWWMRWMGLQIREFFVWDHGVTAACGFPTQVMHLPDTCNSDGLATFLELMYSCWQRWMRGANPGSCMFPSSRLEAIACTDLIFGGGNFGSVLPWSSFAVLAPGNAELYRHRRLFTERLLLHICTFERVLDGGRDDGSRASREAVLSGLFQLESKLNYYSIYETRIPLLGFSFAFFLFFSS